MLAIFHQYPTTTALVNCFLLFFGLWMWTKEKIYFFVKNRSFHFRSQIEGAAAVVKEAKERQALLKQGYLNLESLLQKLQDENLQTLDLLKKEYLAEANRMQLRATEETKRFIENMEMDFEDRAYRIWVESVMKQVEISVSKKLNKEIKSKYLMRTNVLLKELA